MALMVGEVYDAFLAAKVPEAQARKAAEAVAVGDERFARIDARFEKVEERLGKLEGELVLHRYMLGTILGGVVVLILKAFF